MGDALDASEQALMNFEVSTVHDAFLQAIEDNQGTSGDVPVVIPNSPPRGDNCNDIAWTSAYPQLTQMQHQYYGDTRTLARKWPSLVAYQEHLIAAATGGDPEDGGAYVGLAVCDRFKDWLCGNAQSCCSGCQVRSPGGNSSSCSPKSSSGDSGSCPVGAEMGGFNYVLGLRAMSDIATVLGNSSAATRYSTLAQTGTTEFQKFFWNETVQRYGGDLGAIQSLTLPALKIGAPPAALLPVVVKTLNDDLVERTNYTLRVGAVTSKILLNVLSENGLHETALRTATGTVEPSWGWWWQQGLTTCAEAFPNTRAADGTGSPHGTLNHIFLCGGIGHWYWKHLVGLTPTSPGFATVRIAPKVHDTLGPKSVGGEFLSPKGGIVSNWTITGNGAAAGVALDVSLPVGVSAATIVVPKPTTGGHPSASAVIKLGGTTIWDGTKLVGKPPAGIKSATDEPAGVAIETTNGIFEFASTRAA